MEIIMDMQTSLLLLRPLSVLGMKSFGYRCGSQPRCSKAQLLHEALSHVAWRSAPLNTHAAAQSRLPARGVRQAGVRQRLHLFPRQGQLRLSLCHSYETLSTPDFWDDVA